MPSGSCQCTRIVTDIIYSRMTHPNGLKNVKCSLKVFVLVTYDWLKSNYLLMTNDEQLYYMIRFFFHRKFLKINISNWKRCTVLIALLQFLGYNKPCNYTKKPRGNSKTLERYLHGVNTNKCESSYIS